MQIESIKRLFALASVVLFVCGLIATNVATAEDRASSVTAHRISNQTGSADLLVSAHASIAMPDGEDDFWLSFDLRKHQQVTGQPATQEKTVEQVRKNIKVLTGLPDSQLEGVMDYMKASLGVNCTFCHVRTGEKWEYEKDDKKEKQAARKMIQMVFEMNKSNKDSFGSRPANCFMCHRGEREPAITATLPLPAPQRSAGGGPGGGPGGPRAAGGQRPTATPTPTVDQILDKYLQAIGGAAAFEKFKSRMSKGTQAGANGVQIPVEVWQTAPNKIVSAVTTQQGQTISQGFNGTVGWQKTSNNQSELAGAKLEELRRVADFTRFLRLRESFPTLRFGGRARVNDRDTQTLLARAPDGRTDLFFFDSETGLLFRVLTVLPTLLGPVPEQVDLSDYRDVDGVKLPFTIQQSYYDLAASWTRKFTEVKHNVAVDDSRFNPPARN